jgi:hypothetical protein
MIVALVALFVALGGSALAASLISGSRLRNRSVSGAKIKRDALTGTEIRESRLGTVRNANAVGGLTVRKFTFSRPNGTADPVLLRLAGLTVRGHCEGNAPKLSAVTSVNNTVEHTAVIDDVGHEGHSSSDNDFDSTGGSRDLTVGVPAGAGTFVYQRRDGHAVTITYGFQASPTLGSGVGGEGTSACSIAGTAIGG